MNGSRGVRRNLNLVVGGSEVGACLGHRISKRFRQGMFQSLEDFGATQGVLIQASKC